MNNYSVENYIKDIRKVIIEEASQKSITERIKPLAQRLAEEKSWIKPEYYNVNDEQGFGLHLLHEEEDHRLAVFVIAWAPGKGLAPHNHKTWAVVAGIQGQEHETNYKRLDKLKLIFLLSVISNIGIKIIEKQLLSNRPSIILFDIYKILYYVKIKKNV